MAVDGGYRVTGRWPFGTGCPESAWMLGSFQIKDGDRPRKACRHFLGGGGHGAEAAQRGVWLAPSSKANPAART